jgi:hypothetical protein
MTIPAPTRVLIEVRRKGRRPRYHLGARQGTTLLAPEQCNTDDTAGELVELEELPEYPAMRRPWAQLCKRCFRGQPILEEAERLRIALGKA